MINREYLEYLPSLLSLCTFGYTSNKRVHHEKIFHRDTETHIFMHFSYTYNELIFGYSLIRKILFLYSDKEEFSIKKYYHDRFGTNLMKYFTDDFYIFKTKVGNILRPQYIFSNKLSSIPGDNITKICITEIIMKICKGG